MKVLMLTVTYNNSSQCMALLKSLPKDKSVDKMVIVDNGSREDEFEKLRKGIKSLRNSRRIYLDKGENIGLSRAWNKVIRKFSNYDYYIIVSSDVILREDTVAKLCRAMSKKKSKNVILSSVLYSLVNFKKTDILQSAGTFFKDSKKVRFSLMRALNLSKKDDRIRITEKDLLKHDEIKCSDTAFGCFLFSRGVLEKMGLFNENFFIFNEDSDLFVRLKEANIPIYLVTGAKIWHPVESMSTSDDNDFILYHRILSSILFYRFHRKHMEAMYLPKYSVFVFLKLVQSLLRLKFKRIKVILNAYILGFRKKLVPIPKMP